MINQLVAALGQELGLTSKEIADVVWLALQMQTPESALKGTGKAPSSTIEPASRQSKSTVSEASNLFSERDRTKDAQSSQSPRAELHMPNSQMDGQGGFGSGLPLKVPDARSLREPLSLARSLKPFLKKVTAGLSTELDEVATVERIADEGVWLPVLKPALEPWLDLALVVDESLSMQLWHQTIAELQRLLSHYGVFRDIRVWSLVTNDHGQMVLRSRLGAASRSKTEHRPKELIDPSGRRLILVATDCVDAIWQNGLMLPALKLWAESGPMAIIQMLPEWLWARTGLGFASAVKLHSLMSGVPNQQLDVRDLSSWDEVDLRSGIRVPVVTLEPEPFLAWSKMVSAKGGVWSLGFVFESERVTALDRASHQPLLGDATPEQRVQQFRSTASPMARRLASLLAAAPAINLPIVRIIQDRLLPQSRQVHVAEVFLGGLLKPLSGNQTGLNPNLVPFDFLSRVRSLLLESLPTDDSINVIREVSQFVADRLGLSLDTFSVLLKSPQQTSDRKLASQARPFALVTASILKNLGGKYSDLASEIEYANQLAAQQNSNSNFRKMAIRFQVGGSLGGDNASYVFRKADSDLYESLKQGVFCYVLEPRQVGKSSLRVRITQRLQEEGIAWSFIDLTMIGSHDITPEQWYLEVMRRLARSLGLKVKVLPWWNEHSGLSPVQRLGDFLEDVVLAELAQPIVIFIDEIDAILQVDFKDDFFALLHACYSQRNNKPVFQRLNFVVLGVATHLDLMQDQKRSPFNIGKSIHLKGFTLAEAQALSDDLIEVAHDPQAVLREILNWTGGQPLLTQKLCRLVTEARPIELGQETQQVGRLVQERILTNWESQDEPAHLRTIRDRLLRANRLAWELLEIYQQVLQKGGIAAVRDPVQMELQLSGLVVEDQGRLRVSNRIYEAIFNQTWVNEYLKNSALAEPLKVRQKIDEKLSRRFIELDPGGYFLIYLDREQGLICTKHFTNIINDKGLACDPVTGEPLPNSRTVERQHTRVYIGRTAKELCIAIFEDPEHPCPIFYLDHAAYLGREFVRAEMALISGSKYIQD